MPSNTANGHSLSSTIRLLSPIFLAPCSLTLYTHRYSMLSHLKIHAKPTECGEDEGRPRATLASQLPPGCDCHSSRSPLGGVRKTLFSTGSFPFWSVGSSVRKPGRNCKSRNRLSGYCRRTCADSTPYFHRKLGQPIEPTSQAARCQSPDRVTPNRGGPEIESHVCLAGTRKKYELASWFSLKFKLIN
jgi:hypothetical protein